MTTKSYPEKLKDPRWQKKRLEILNRDNWRCCVTGCFNTEKTLHVHHLDYISGKDPWEYPDEYFMTVCENCHEEISNERPVFEKQIIKEFRLKLKDTFIQSCAAQLFKKLSDEQLHGVVYMLWEIMDNPQELHDGVQRLYWEIIGPQIDAAKQIISKRKVLNG